MQSWLAIFTNLLIIYSKELWKKYFVDSFAPIILNANKRSVYSPRFVIKEQTHCIDFIESRNVMKIPCTARQRIWHVREKCSALKWATFLYETNGYFSFYWRAIYFKLALIKVTSHPVIGVGVWNCVELRTVVEHFGLFADVVFQVHAVDVLSAGLPHVRD